MRQTAPDVIAEIDTLLDHHTNREIAEILNGRARQSGWGKPFNTVMLARLERDYSLRSRYDRLRAAGMLTLEEIAARLGVATATVKVWRRGGLLKAHAYNDKLGCLYEPPGADAPTRHQGKRLSKILQERDIVTRKPKEVQCET